MWQKEEEKKTNKQKQQHLAGKKKGFLPLTLYNWLTVRNIPLRTLLPNGVSLCVAFMLTTFSVLNT